MKSAQSKAQISIQIILIVIGIVLEMVASRYYYAGQYLGLGYAIAGGMCFLGVALIRPFRDL